MRIKDLRARARISERKPVPEPVPLPEFPGNRRPMRYAHLSPDARRDAVKLLDVRDGAKLVWMTSRGIILEISLDGSRSTLRSAA